MTQILRQPTRRANFLLAYPAGAALQELVLVHLGVPAAKSTTTATIGSIPAKVVALVSASQGTSALHLQTSQKCRRHQSPNQTHGDRHPREEASPASNLQNLAHHQPKVEDHRATDLVPPMLDAQGTTSVHLIQRIGILSFASKRMRYVGRSPIYPVQAARFVSLIQGYSGRFIQMPNHVSMDC